MQNSENYLFINTTKINGYPTFDIKQKNLIYSDMLTHHGCQSMQKDPKNGIILTLCRDVVNIIRKIEFYNNWTNEEIKDLFAKTYNFNSFVNWIEEDIADFRFYGFTLQQMIHSLSYLYDYETVIKKFTQNICPKCKSNCISKIYTKEYQFCEDCGYEWEL